MSSDTIGGSVNSYIRERGGTIPSAAVVLPTIGIVVSELALFYGYLYVSLAGHLLTLSLCIFGPLTFTRELPMFQVFALVPVFRLVNLGMPVFFELTLYWFPLVYGPLFPAMYIVLTRRPDLKLEFNPKAAVLLLPLGIALGAVLAEMEYRIISPGALITAPSAWQLLLLTAVMVLFVGAVEELLFRGILQSALVDSIGYWPGLLLANFLFGMMHSAYASGPEVAFAAVIGLLFGLIYTWTRSILLITVIHGLLNVFLFGYLPIYGSMLRLLGV